MRKLAELANEIYVFELFAIEATAHQPRSKLKGKKFSPRVDKEAACAALMGGTAKVNIALPFACVCMDGMRSVRGHPDERSVQVPGAPAPMPVRGRITWL